MFTLRISVTVPCRMANTHTAIFQCLEKNRIFATKERNGDYHRIIGLVFEQLKRKNCWIIYPEFIKKWVRHICVYETGSALIRNDVVVFYIFHRGEVNTTPERGRLNKPRRGIVRPAPKRRWLSLRSSHCGLITSRYP